MTRIELRQKLDDMDEQELSILCADFGGGDLSRHAVVRHYVDHPEHERRICQLLGLTMEEEKAVKAAVSSARSARWSMICAVISSLAALFSVFLR